MVFPIVGGDGKPTGYDIENSLRFNDDDLHYLERTFDSKTQQELLDLTIKLKGRDGFPHLEFDEDDGALIDEVTTSLGEEKISSNYWRSRASCNAKACAQMKEMGLLSYVG